MALPTDLKWDIQDLGSIRIVQKNIPFSVGNQNILWEKIMKEVEVCRYAGPFEVIPFEYYIQSPVGLVPKAGNQTRLIFHLSYNFSEDEKSVYFYTDKGQCRVKYRDLDHAIQNSISYLRDNDKAQLWYSKSDLKSAFCVLPLKGTQ